MSTFETHVVKLIRKNNKGAIHGVASDDSFLLNSSEDINHFFMFDYFDLLVHKQLKGSCKKYSNFLGMEETFDDLIYNGVSSKILSLYKRIKKEDMEYVSDKRLFKIDRGNFTDTLSEMPFIGLIQIVINPNQYQKWKKADDLLQFCYDKISNTAREYLNPNSSYEIFQTLTTGDFCLVIRTGDIGTIYQASIAIGKLKENDELFTAYTNVGMECVSRIDENNEIGYLTLSEGCIDDNTDNKISIRFSCKDDYMKKLMMFYEEEDIRGVFGRYDYLIRLSIREFAAIYPALCKTKLTEIIKEAGDLEYKPKSKIDAFIYGISHGFLHNINERILTSSYIEDKPGSVNKADVNNIPLQDNNDILEQFTWLSRQEIYFVKGRRNFLDAKRALKELIHIYASLRSGADSCLSGRLQRIYISALFKNLKAAMDVIVTDERENLRIHLIEDMKTTVEAINQFTKFLQSINLLTVQAPQYEIQTKVDSEKLIVAYQEYMYQYLCTYSKWSFNKVKENTSETGQIKMLPIIYPDFNIGRVTVSTPFGEYYGFNDMPRIIICRVPSFEYFGRIYELIPWLSHEIGHSMLILDRRVRNIQLVDMVFQTIFECVVQKWLSDNDVESALYRYGLLKRELSAVIKYIFMKSYLKGKPDIGAIRMKELELDIVQYLMQFVNGYNDYRFRDLNYRFSGKEGIKYIINSLMEMMLRYNALEDDEIERLKSIYDTWENKYDISQQYDIKAFMEGLFTKVAVKINEEMYHNLPEIDRKFVPEIKFGEINIDSADINEVILKRSQELNDNMKALKMNNEKVKTIHAIMRDYFYQIKKLHHMYLTFYKLLTDTSTYERGYASDLLKEFEIQMRKAMAPYYDMDEDRVNIFDSHLNYVIRTIGFSFQEHDNGKSKIVETLSASMTELSKNQIESWKDRAVGMYREVCADLIMCRIMKFSSFGYFKLLMFSAGDIDYNLEGFYSDVLNMRRMRLVISTLLTLEKGSCEDKEGYMVFDSLKNSIKNYCERLLDGLGDRILKKVRSELTKEIAKDVWKSDQDYVNSFIKEAKDNFNILLEKVKDENISDFKSIFTSKEVRDNILNKDKTDDLHSQAYNCLIKYWYIFDRIHTMLIGYNNLIHGERIKRKDSRLKHFEYIYKETEFLKVEKDRDFMINITGYYNSNFHMKDFNTDKKLDHLFEFTEEYYYSNRIRIAGISDDV